MKGNYIGNNPNLSDDYETNSSNLVASTKCVYDAVQGYSCNVKVMSTPTITGSNTVAIGTSATYNLSAIPALNNTTISSFTVNITGQAEQIITASNNSGSVSFTVPSNTVEGTQFTIIVVATDSLGNKSAEGSKVITTIAAFVNKPSVLVPASGSEVFFKGGITVTTSAFSTTGATDTHATTSYKITSDASGNNVVAQALNSTDKITHTFPSNLLSSIVDGNTYYIFVKHNGTTLGESEWSNSVSFTAKSGVLSPTGRMLYRHESNEGTVIEYQYWGATQKLFVADAKYRSIKDFGAEETDTSLPNITAAYKFLVNGTTKSNTEAFTASEYTNWLTDSKIESTITTECKETKTARQNCDVWMTYSDTDAVHFCRNTLADTFSGGCDLPNIRQLCTIYAESDQLDEMDPTASAYPAYKLGYTAQYGRFNLNNNTRVWSCSEYSSKYCHDIGCNGYVYDDIRFVTYGVAPVREIS